MLSDKLADIVIRNNDLSEEDKVILNYGLSKMVMLVQDMIITLAMGWVLGILVESLVFQITFMALRMYAGGFHAETELACKIQSVVVTLASLLLIRFLPDAYLTGYCFLMMVFSAAGGLIAPVEAKNKPLSAGERIVYRKRTIIILAALNLTALSGLYLHVRFLCKTIPVTIGIVFFLMIAGCLQKED